MSHAPRRLVGLWILSAVALVLAGRFGLAAQTPANSEGPIQIADALMAEQRYQEAFALYRGARMTEDPKTRIRAGAGAVRALLRVGMFSAAQLEGASIAAAASG